MRRLAILLVTGLLLAACGGGSSASPSATASASPVVSPSASASSAQIVGPVILDRSTTSATVPVGRFVVFSLDKPGSWEIAATPDGIMKVQKGSEDGSATFNPGAEALAPGTATVTLTSPAGETLVYTITVR